MAEIVQTSGETWMHLFIKNGKKGVELQVKAHPLIEEFFKNQADKMIDASSGSGKQWFQVDEKPLEVYPLTQERAEQAYSQGYNLIYHGYGFFPDGPDAVNLSFLRIRGIGSGDWVKFGVIGPMSLPARRELKRKIGRAVWDFCKDYIVPVELELEIISR